MATAIQSQPRSASSLRTARILRDISSAGGVTVLALTVVIIFLAPLAYMGFTAFKTLKQIQDPYSQLLPSSPVLYTYEGKEYPLLNIPIDGTIKQMALIKPGRESSELIDPSNPDAGLILWDGRWRVQQPVYRFDATLANFPESWKQIRLDRLYINTLIIAVLGTIGALVSSIVVAYGFSRFRIPGIEILFIILISTIILPRQVTLIPTYIFWRWLMIDVLGTETGWWPLIVPHFFANAYNVFLLRQYFKGIPRDLDEAAMIDGASPFQTLMSVIIPQAIPAITAVGLFHFFFAWNDFFEPLVYLQGRADLHTISIGMTQFNNIYTTQPGLAMAAAMMAIALPVIMFFVAQRVFMQGIVITGVDK